MQELLKRAGTKEVFLYIIFGILTTLVNIGTFYWLYKGWLWNENIANLLAIFLAINFAYFTNKDLVFHTKASKPIEKIREYCKFIIGRAFTAIIELIGGVILFQTIIPEMVSKVFLTLIVIVLNFVISKYFTFKNKK